MMEKKRFSRKGARRRVRTRTALFLYAGCAAGLMGLALLSPLTGPGLRVWLGALFSLLCFALPAYLGLFVLDGDQRQLVMRRKLSGAQALWLCASGALLVCPATLLGDVGAALLGRFGVQAAAAQGGADAALLVPMLLASGVIAPLCEEVFFRGYLLGALSRRGTAEAALVTAALFAAAHGTANLLPLFLMGLLFAAAALHAGSVLASVCLHMAYNVTLIVLSALPASMLLTGLTPLSCIARLCGCAALFYTFKRFWRARGVRQADDAALTLREGVMLAVPVLLVLLVQILGEVMGL